MTRYRSAAARANSNAYKREYNRQKSPVEDFMYNLLKMGPPSSIVEHEPRGRCDVGWRKCEQATVILVYPHDYIRLCAKHEELRRKGKTR